MIDLMLDTYRKQFVGMDLVLLAIFVVRSNPHFAGPVYKIKNLRKTQAPFLPANFALFPGDHRVDEDKALVVPPFKFLTRLTITLPGMRDFNHNDTTKIAATLTGN
jgi:hypothetical protein